MVQNTDLCTQMEYLHVISNAFRDGREKSSVASLDNVTFHAVNLTLLVAMCSIIIIKYIYIYSSNTSTTFYKVSTGLWILCKKL